MTNRDALFHLVEFALEGAKDDAGQLAIYDTTATLAEAINEPATAQICRDLANTLREIEQQNSAAAERQLQFLEMLTQGRNPAQ